MKKRLLALFGLAFGVGCATSVSHENSFVAHAEEVESQTFIIENSSYATRLDLYVDTFDLFVQREVDAVRHKTYGTYTMEENIATLTCYDEQVFKCECNNGILNLIDITQEELFNSIPVINEELDEETEEEIEKGVIAEISQVCKDCIAFMKELCSMPIFIGGVSTTIGALAIAIISKALGGLSKKKVKEILKKYEELCDKLANCVSKEELEKVLKDNKALVSSLKELAPTIKNANVRKNIEETLKECEPIKEDLVKFVNEETKLVVEDTKNVSTKASNSVLDILNKD